MKKKEEFLTPDDIGEMYVKWRLEEGLFASEGEEKIISLVDKMNHRSISLNDFAREVGEVMMQYLSSHPDVGFESFRRNLWKMGKIGNVGYHSAKLDGECPHIQILEAVSSAYANYEDCNPSVMTAYVVLGSNQKIQMHQYARLKLQTCINYGIKYWDMNITYNADTNSNDIGSIQMWIA